MPVEAKHLRSSIRLLVVVALGALVTVGTAGGSNHARESRPDPRTLVLQPRDLPRGYQFGDDSVCGSVSADEGSLEKLKVLFDEEPTTGCIMQLTWVWNLTPPHERVVTSAAYVFRDASVARRAFAARDELAMFSASLSPTTRKSVRLGEQAELVRGRGLNHRASAVIWRRGQVVALLAVEPANDAVAWEFAQRQEKLLEHPSAPVADRPMQANEAELKLDDPGIELPIHWLGSLYDPHDGGGPMKLSGADVGTQGGPGQSIKLFYGTTTTVDTWQPGRWKKFLHTRLGRLIWDSPCARKTTVKVDGGRAEIFEGYGGRAPVEPPCPSVPPNLVTAHVYYHDVVVAIDAPYCFECPMYTDRRGEALATMERLVGDLRLRPRQR